MKIILQTFFCYQLIGCSSTYSRTDSMFLLSKESLNCDGKQFHQYQCTVYLNTSLTVQIFKRLYT